MASTYCSNQWLHHKVQTIRRALKVNSSELRPQAPKPSHPPIDLPVVGATAVLLEPRILAYALAARHHMLRDAGHSSSKMRLMRPAIRDCGDLAFKTSRSPHLQRLPKQRTCFEGRALLHERKIYFELRAALAPLCQTLLMAAPASKDAAKGKPIFEYSDVA